MRYESTYLQHYGVKGMKWGVRRHQKKDGTRTTEGKKRNRKLAEVSNRIPEKHKKAAKGVARSISTIYMSDLIGTKLIDNGYGYAGRFIRTYGTANATLHLAETGYNFLNTK